jgi:DNA replication and repair protein RecF
LLDDIAAELDREHQKRMSEMLVETTAQIIATATDQSNNLNLAWKRYSKFHVKHGSITEHC